MKRLFSILLLLTLLLSLFGCKDTEETVEADAEGTVETEE